MHSHQADKLGSGPKFGSGKASLAQDFPPRNATLLMMSFSTWNQLQSQEHLPRFQEILPGKQFEKAFSFTQNTQLQELHQEHPLVMVPGPMSEKFRCAVAAYCGLSRGQFSAGENGKKGPKRGFLWSTAHFQFLGMALNKMRFVLSWTGNFLGWPATHKGLQWKWLLPLPAMAPVSWWLCGQCPSFSGGFWTHIAFVEISYRYDHWHLSSSARAFFTAPGPTAWARQQEL